MNDPRPAENPHRPVRHCPLCGSSFAPATVEGRQRLRCEQCFYVQYANPAAAAAGVVVNAQGQVLLVRRAIAPHRGMWALPAGYQEVDETPAQAAEREVREETGLEVEAGPLFDLVFVTDNAAKPANLAVYLCRPLGGELAAGDDASEVRFFDLTRLPDDIGFDNTTRILSRLIQSRTYREFLQPMTQPKTTTPRSISYKDAGVDIENKYAAVDGASAAIRASFTPGVVGDVGGFGGLFDLARAGCGRGLLVASADGVGTKLEIAARAKIYDTVGRDLVQHCINDILVQGARPLFFMDYVGTGVLDPHVTSELIRGCAEGCRENGLALLGGETAEMPGLYRPGDFDLVGFIVGVVEPDKLLDGKRVRPGQVLVALASAGLHTNGYSLARKIAFEALGHELGDRPAALAGRSVGEALLAEHRSYLKLLWPLLEERRIAAMAHITGGGLVDNLPRVLNGCDALIDRTAWPLPPVFRWLCEGGNVDPEERYQVFNMGIGMVLILDPDQVDSLRAQLAAAGEPTWIIGRTEAGQGIVRWTR
ncbi:MAG TPA: phosphoribosylformylglycinamidine cyclo-ligase [Planctomycetota bacterium]|nr:phosphoribosylformylglycinamidine cyclo-ligase [Planctomycetota bacterium]